MEKCLTPEERQEKKTVIRYLRGELKERLDYLNGCLLYTSNRQQTSQRYPFRQHLNNLQLHLLESLG